MSQDGKGAEYTVVATAQASVDAGAAERSPWNPFGRSTPTPI